jgi:hypothetical protein
LIETIPESQRPEVVKFKPTFENFKNLLTDSGQDKKVYLTHVELCDIEIPPEIFEKVAILSMEYFSNEGSSKTTQEILDEAHGYLG